MPKKDRRQLEDLTVEEISLVDRPANPGARVVLLKMGGKDGIMTPTDERASLLKRLASYLGVGDPTTDDTVKKEDQPMADEALKKQIDDVTKQLEDVTKQLAAAQAEIAKRDSETKAAAEAAAKAAAEAADEAAFAARLPESLAKSYKAMDKDGRAEFRKAFSTTNSEAVLKAIAAAVSDSAAKDQRIAKLEEADEVRKIRDEMSDLKDGVQKFDEFVSSVYSLRKSDKAAADNLVAQVRASVAQVKAAGLFKTIGKDGEGSSDADSAIDKAAEALMKADPKLSKAEAVTKALENDPKLYAAYEAEKEGK